MNRAAYTSQTSKNNNQFLAMMGRIQGCYKKNQLHLLLFMVDMCSKNFSDTLTRVILPEPRTDQNLNMTIEGRCSLIKARNNELKKKALNMLATISKQIFNNRKNQNERKYQETIQSIRQKGFSIREKIAKLKRQQVPYCNVTNNNVESTKTVVLNLKKATELLSHETIKARAEFNTLVELLPQPQFGSN